MTAAWMRYGVFAGIAVCALGCSGGSGDGAAAGDVDEEEAVGSLASSLPDYATRPAKEFNENFAEGSAPDATTRRKYKDYVFSDPKVSISGDTATITLKSYYIKGQQESQVTWTAVKQDGAWKLKDAPLP